MANRKKGRSTIVVAPVKNRAEARERAGKAAETILKRDGAKIDMKSAVTDLKRQWEGTIDGLEETITAETAALHQWSVANPDEFHGKRSIEFARSRFGFTLNPENVTPTPQQRKDKGLVVEVAKHDRRLNGDYLVSEPKLDRPAILAAVKAHDRYQGLGDSAIARLPEADRHLYRDGKLLHELGLGREQKETFFVEPVEKADSPTAAKTEQKQPA